MGKMMYFESVIRRKGTTGDSLCSQEEAVLAIIATNALFPQRLFRSFMVPYGS